MNIANRVEFLKHARLQMPREACALLIISDGRERLKICKNVAEYDQQFIIDPIDFAEADESGEIIAVIHSHAYGSSSPSEADKVSCSRLNYKWYIVSCLNGEWSELEPNAYKAPLVGREWCHGILDCYALVKDYYKEVLNIDLIDYDRDFDWWHKGFDLIEKNYKLAGFVDVGINCISEHDLLLMQIQSPVINHCGIFLKNSQFLHHTYKRLSSRDVYGGYWLKNTVRVVRHRSLMK